MTRRPAPPSLSVAFDSGVPLTERERALLTNFRTIDRGAQDFLIGTAAQFARTFPAKRPRLRLVASSKGGA
jgi:hypothetical protein